MNESTIERFNAKINKQDDGCWIWTAGKMWRGYGLFQLRAKQCRRAHRIAYEIANGPIPDGMCVLHSCDVRSCVNPEHLFIGTQKDNAVDRNIKERQARGEGHGCAKLTEDDVREIRMQYSSGGTTLLKIARAYQISQSAVSMITTRKNWKHVR